MSLSRFCKRMLFTTSLGFNLVLAGSLGEGVQAQNRLRLATTTSTANSGLLRLLLPPFEKTHGVRVDVIPVGTGKALELGRNGDVDVVMVHAPDAEIRFVQEGHGVNRRQFMYNDFVVLGPSEDPAVIRRVKDAVRAFSLIEKKGATFVSRGDESGTHRKERRLWEKTGRHPTGAWYLEVGQGMGKTLIIADERRAYTLSDRGTYLAFRDKVGLEVLLEGDPRLLNPYGIIAVNPSRHPHVRHRMAMALIEYVNGPRAQAIIRTFTVAGQPLFTPVTIP